MPIHTEGFAAFESRLRDEETAQRTRSRSKKSKHTPLDDMSWVQPWYYPGTSTDRVDEQLEGAVDGAFGITDGPRASTFVLSFRHHGRTKHARILDHPDGLYLEGSSWHFEELANFVRHYSSSVPPEPELLPVSLLASLRLEDGGSSSRRTRGAATTTTTTTTTTTRGGGAAFGDPWTTADVEDWLVRIGFSQYVDAFVSHRVDGVMLANMTDDDLYRIGVRRAQHRAELLMEIQKLTRRVQAGATREGASLRRRTYVVREIGGQVKIFDAETGEEIHEIANELIGEVRAARGSSNNNNNLDERETVTVRREYRESGGERRGRSSSNGGGSGTRVHRRVHRHREEDAYDDMGPAGEGGYRVIRRHRHHHHGGHKTSSSSRRSRHTSRSAGGMMVGDTDTGLGMGMVSWWQIGVPREEALAMLEGQPDGTFVIRDSARPEGGYVLTFVYGGRLVQKYIEVTEEPAGVFLADAPDKLFRDMQHLVAYYSYPQQELPIPLLVLESSSDEAMMTMETDARFFDGGAAMLGPHERLTLESQHNVAEEIESDTKRRTYMLEHGMAPAGTGSHYDVYQQQRFQQQQSASWRGAQFAEFEDMSGWVQNPAHGRPSEHLTLENQHAVATRRSTSASVAPVVVGPRRSTTVVTTTSAAPKSQKTKARRSTANANTMPVRRATALVDGEERIVEIIEAPANQQQQQQRNSTASTTSRKDRRKERRKERKASKEQPQQQPQPPAAAEAQPQQHRPRMPLPDEVQEQQKVYSTIQDEVPDNRRQGRPSAGSLSHPERSNHSVARTRGEDPFANQHSSVKPPRASTIDEIDEFSWMRLDWPKKEAVKQLAGAEDGEFVVHEADDAFGELTMVFNGQQMSRKIDRSNSGYKLSGTGRYFPDLYSLVAYHQSADNTDLPCPLVTVRADDV